MTLGQDCPSLPIQYVASRPKQRVKRGAALGPSRSVLRRSEGSRWQTTCKEAGMRWDRGHESPDVIDRRGEGGRVPMGGLLALLPFLLRSKIGWLILLGAGAYYLLQGGLGGSAQRAVHQGPEGGPAVRANHDLVEFVSFVLDDAQRNWAEIFRERGRAYQHAKMVLFTDSTSTGCGYGDAATGPFYCPTDRRVYIDLGFY